MGFKIIFVDEVHFQRRDADIIKTWQKASDNLVLIDRTTSQGNVKVFAAMDTQRLLYYKIIKKKFDSDVSCDCLSELKEQLKKTARCAVFYDGAR